MRAGMRTVRSAMLTIRAIVVPTDFSEPSRAALSYARQLSSRLGATIHVLHVVDELAARFIDVPDYAALGRFQTALEQSARRDMDALLSEDELRQGIDVRGEIVTAHSVAEAIVKYAAELPADLIVMGTHGRGAIGRLFLGTVAERVVRTASCPVLTVREDAGTSRTDALRSASVRERVD